MTNDDQRAKLRFTCYLLRPGITDVERALRLQYRPGGSRGLQRVPASPAAPAGAAAYLGKPLSRSPKWAQELDVLFPGVGAVANQSNRLVIFLPVEDRTFAVCFGYGYSTIDWDAIEPNFGLKVAARALSADNVIEIRTRRIDSTARTQSVHVPSGSDLRDLDVPLDGEFVRKLSGRLDETGIEIDGAVVAGDSIAFKSDVDLRRVQVILSQMLASVRDARTRDAFQFVDALEPMRGGRELTQRLDSVIAAQILQKPRLDDEFASYATHLLEFAPPDDVRLDEVDRLDITRGTRTAVVRDLSLDGVRDALTDLDVRRGREFLSKVRIMAVGHDDEPRSQMLPLRHWLVFEFGDALSRFILTVGQWFRLHEPYTQRLNRELRRIEDVTVELDLPQTGPNEHEVVYNARVAAGRGDVVLMDRVNVGTTDGGRFEACDLFTGSGHLVHVKRYNGSQTLSHLFSQGLVSAELLGADEAAKSDFVRKVADRDVALKAAAESAPRIVTYAIAITDQYELPLGLPTFSKVNLRDFANRIRRMQVRPTLARIPVR